METKIRREPFRLRRIDPALLIANEERSGRGLIVFIPHTKDDLVRRLAVEKNVHLVAESEVLGSLADIEFELGLALAGVAAVELHHAIFQRQAGQFLFQRLVIGHLQIEPKFRVAPGRTVFAALAVKFVRSRLPRPALID